MPPILKSVTRLDSTPVNPAFFTNEGFLIDRPILTSTGIFEYLNSDGSVRRELRLPEDVFEPKSLASYEGKPIIITHDAGLVNKDNVHRFQIGTILTEGYRSGEDVRAKIIIHDTDEMKECGLKELSLGYNLDLEEVPGEWEGQHYDAIQRNIRINHLALVHAARAGEQARLNIDGREENSTTLKGGKKMKRKNMRRSDSVLSPEELKKAIEEYKARRAAEKKDEDDTTVVEEVEKADEEATEIETKVAEVQENRDRRDADEEAETLKEANEVITNQDEDIKTLLDIIDTLLAEKEFDEAEAPEEETEETVKKDADDSTKSEEVVEEEIVEDGCGNKDEDEEIVEEEIVEEEIVEDGCDKEDEDEEEIVDEEIIEDEEDEIVEDEDEEEIIKEDACGKMNADSIDKIVRQRIKLGMIGKQLNLDGLENMKVMSAKKKIIKTVRPSVNLDGKSETYINAMFDCAVEDVKRKSKKGVSYQKKQMFNKDSAPKRSKVDSNMTSSELARQKMIKRRHNTNKEV